MKLFKWIAGLGSSDTLWLVSTYLGPAATYMTAKPEITANLNPTCLAEAWTELWKNGGEGSTQQI